VSECFLTVGNEDLRNEGQKTQAERLKLILVVKNINTRVANQSAGMLRWYDVPFVDQTGEGQLSD
jgi:hypothetical protein